MCVIKHIQPYCAMLPDIGRPESRLSNRQEIPVTFTISAEWGELGDT